MKKKQEGMIAGLVSFFLITWIAASNSRCSPRRDCSMNVLNASILCSSNTSNSDVIPTQLNIPGTLYYNTSYEFNATVNASNGSNYSFLFCFERSSIWWWLNRVYPIDCITKTDYAVVNNTVWPPISGKMVTVYVFTTEENSTRYGCDYREVTVGKVDNDIEFSVNLTQGNNSKSPFKVGNITIMVHSKHNKTNNLAETECVDITANFTDDFNCSSFDAHSNVLGSNDHESGSSSSSSSGSGEHKSSESKDILYKYGFYYENKTMNICPGNRSCIIYNLDFPNETNLAMIFVEVMREKIVNGMPKLSYNNKTTNISVLEPITNPKLVQGNGYVNEDITITIDVDGSLPIKVYWELKSSDTNSTLYCDKNDTTITKGNKTSREFHCTFNAAGDYQLNAMFENEVSNETMGTVINMHQSPPIAVVATSTTLVVVLVIVMVIVIICIVGVASYIPYRRYKMKSTETANFSFIDLRRPSRLDGVKLQAKKLKERFTKRKAKVGLVNYRDDNSLDSFYGSLNPFAAHESL